MNRYIVRNAGQVDSPVVGVLELDPSVNPAQFVHMASSGNLNLVQEKSPEKEALIAAEQAKNEAALDDPEASMAATQAEIDAAASVLPDGDYAYADLRPKQLKAICRKAGLPEYGTKETIIARLQDNDAAPVPSPGTEVDLATCTVAQLQKIATTYDLSTTGKKAELIDRITAYIAEQGDDQDDAGGAGDDQDDDAGEGDAPAPDGENEEPTST